MVLIWYGDDDQEVPADPDDEDEPEEGSSYVV